MVIFNTCPKCGHEGSLNIYGKNCIKGSYCPKCHHTVYPEVKEIAKPKAMKDVI